MESTLKQTLLVDNPLLLVPLTDDPIDSGGKVSAQGDWADDAGISQLDPKQTKYGAGIATFALGGVIGPTDEDALLMTQVAQLTGYVMRCRSPPITWLRLRLRSLRRSRFLSRL
jgi:hypothetical protein